MRIHRHARFKLNPLHARKLHAQVACKRVSRALQKFCPRRKPEKPRSAARCQNDARAIVADRVAVFKGQRPRYCPAIFKQLDREESLIHLMRINLLKRMESSIHSFSITIGKLLAAVNLLLKKIEKYDAMLDVEELNINEIEIDSELLADLLIGNKVKVLIQDCDTILWRQELEDDRDQLMKLLHVAQQITPERDKKLQALKELIRRKVTAPFNPGNRKV